MPQLGSAAGYAALKVGSFNTFTPGVTDEQPSGILCSSSICETDQSGTTYQNVDFDGDGEADYSFRDRDFNVRSLVGNTVLRWEYRPGSTIFFVWQRNQYGSFQRGDFDFDREFAGLWSTPSENRFIVKVNYWLGL